MQIKSDKKHVLSVPREDKQKIIQLHPDTRKYQTLLFYKDMAIKYYFALFEIYDYVNLTP